MAAEIIGPIVLENLINLLIYEAKLLSGVKDQVSVLKHDLGIMNAFLRDYAGKHKQSHIVKEVMNQSSEVALEAEDVVDDYVAMLLKQNRRKQFKNIFHCFGNASLLHRLANKTTSINNVIKSINDNKASYGITDIEASFDVQAALWVHRRRKYVEEDDVEGLVDEKKKLVGQLTDRNNLIREVISIIGMGGLGKTTLAKQIYRDSLVESHFTCRAWVYVSHVYNLRKLLLDVLKCLIQNDVNNKTAVEDLHRMYVDDLEAKLRQELSGKKYFIVMDDVWKPQVWEEVRVAFPEDKNGSRILITSRNKEVASRASQTPPCFIKRLDLDTSWKLLHKNVFRGGEQCPVVMKNDGMKLAEECKGLPLSIVVLGGILASKEKSQRAWSDILSNKVNSFLIEDREPCLDILALSYHQLPYMLKSCFLYLGIFPTDCEISATDVINMWITEGLIEQIGDRKEAAVAENYLEQLIDRSLIEVSSRRSDGRVKTCHIHDLLRDFCVNQSVQEKFYEVHSEASNLSSRSKHVRRLSVHCCDKFSKYMPESAKETSSARSVMFFGHESKSISQGSESIDLKAWVRLFQCFKFIRVLFLFEVTTFIAGSSLQQLNKLIYLRYFAIKLKGKHTARSTISCSEVPNSISKLRYLEIIDLRFSVLWPKTIWRMKQLRHLSACPMKLQLPDPKSDPKSSEKDNNQLSKLQVLSELHVDHKTVSFIAENKLPNLTKLGLFYDDDKEDHDVMKISEMTAILISLEKLPHLQRLRITGFPQCQRPRLNYFPPTLYKVTLYKTYVDSYLIKILGKLPKLRVLKIKDSTNRFPGRLDVLATEFSELEVFKMDSYGIEMWETEAQAMPNLQHLVICRNRELKTLPDQLWSLKALRLVELSGLSLQLKGSICSSRFVDGQIQLISGKQEFNMINGCKVSVS